MELSGPSRNLQRMNVRFLWIFAGVTKRWNFVTVLHGVGRKQLFFAIICVQAKPLVHSNSNKRRKNTQICRQPRLHAQKKYRDFFSATTCSMATFCRLFSTIEVQVCDRIFSAVNDTEFEFAMPTLQSSFKDEIFEGCFKVVKLQSCFFLGFVEAKALTLRKSSATATLHTYIGALGLISWHISFFDLQARATSEIAVASLRDLENR